jgi:hypothetical protein
MAASIGQRLGRVRRCQEATMSASDPATVACITGLLGQKLASF